MLTPPAAPANPYISPASKNTLFSVSLILYRRRRFINHLHFQGIDLLVVVADAGLFARQSWGLLHFLKGMVFQVSELSQKHLLDWHLL